MTAAGMKPKLAPLAENLVADDSSVQFYIPATSSLLERRPRTLKHGDTFGVFDHYGDIIPGEGNPEGLYHKDTRHLSDLRVLINSRRLLLLSSTVQDNNALLTADLTNPDIFEDDRLELPKDTVHVVRSKFLWQTACYERIAMRSFHDRPQTFTLGVGFASDFADIFEVRGHKRGRRGETSNRVVARDTVMLTYAGLDKVIRRTTIQFDPVPDHLDEGSAVFELALEPRGEIAVFATISCNDANLDRPQRRQFFVCLREARRTLRKSAARAATVETSNEIFNEIVCRSMADYHMLITETPQGPYPYAGIPWFSTAFGRDGIITAAQMLWIDPDVARGVLQYLAARQATDHDPDADAEPGKIMHETRQGELANLGEVPFGLYYGGVDTTPLFVMLAGMYYERTGDLDMISALWPHIEAALEWIDGIGDRGGSGFIAYHRQGDNGLANQGWKDSEDSVFDAEGRLVDGPIALCEVQGYVYAARNYASLMADLGNAAKAATLEHQANTLRERFEAEFWDDELGTYVLALDGDKRACAVATSNAGQVLFTGIAAPERARRIADALLAPGFFNGWGIRTVADTESRYNPMSYHNGSVWPHDNALIALGLARYGFTDHIQRLFSGLFDAASYMDLRRLPELFCGFRRAKGKGPTFYPVACSPQAWACATPFALLQACLGLELDHRAGEIRFRHPRLPDFVDEVFIRGLRFGDGWMDILLRRHESDVSVNVVNKEGDGRVTIIL